MKKTIYIAIFLQTICTGINAQLFPCSYKSLDFEDTEPLWSYLTIDSSMIGYEPSCFYDWQVEQNDGMIHFGFDGGSFIHDGFIYSITEHEICHDISSSLIEKIDLETGELQWQILEDIRSHAFREQISEAKVKKEALYVYGFRENLPDSISTETINFSGQNTGKYFCRIYDVNTGQLLKYFTPPLSDSMAYDVNKRGSSYNFFYEDRLENFIDAKNYIVGKGLNLRRTLIDTLGHLTKPPDTVVVGRFSNRELLKSEAYNRGQLKLSPDNTYLHIEQYSPRTNIETGYTFDAIITEYNSDFEMMRDVNLQEIGIDTFSRLHFVYVDKNHILLHSCSNTFPETASYINCDRQYFLLNTKFELIKTFRPLFNGEQPSYFSSKNIVFHSDSIFYMPFREFIEEGNSNISLYQSTKDGYIQPLKTLTIKEQNWVGSVEFLEVLDDGDVIMKITHSCYKDGAKASWHPEWFRFSAEDMGIPVTRVLMPPSKLEWSLFPNPNSIQVQIRSNYRLFGSIEIYDIMGRIIDVIPANGTRLQRIDTSDLASGSYFIRILNDGRYHGSKKFLKLSQ